MEIKLNTTEKKITIIGEWNLLELIDYLEDIIKNMSEWTIIQEEKIIRVIEKEVSTTERWPYKNPPPIWVGTPPEIHYSSKQDNNWQIESK